MGRGGRAVSIAAIGLVAAVGCSDSDDGTGAICAPSATYVFDSSFSDTGNVWAATFRLYPGDPPYFQGRFSDGPNTVELLARALGTDAVATAAGGTNYAVGGARTAIPTLGLIPPIISQVDDYLAAHVPDPDALHVVRAGANDVLASFGGNGTMEEVAGHLEGVLDELLGAGARHILVLDLPALPTYPAGGADVVAGYNALAGDVVERAAGDVRLFSVHAAVEEMKADPARFGLTDLENPCLSPGGACREDVIDPVADGYLLYDEVHFTTRAHRVISDAAIELLCPG